LPRSSGCEACLPEVTVTRKGADRVLSGHPWIFSSDVVDRGNAQRGDAVHVKDPRGRSLGTFHYSSTSQITLRRLSAKEEPIDKAFFERRLAAAASYRARMVRDSDAWRLVHGEADLLPGLVIDRYGSTYVMQTLSQGMDRAKFDLAEILVERHGAEVIVARNEAHVRKLENLPLEKETLRGTAAPVEITMNGMRWRVDPVEGQKTGVYLDQRENYLAAARVARGRALDAFTSTGGFALHLARTCEHVEAVDSSGVAIETARANASANAIANVEFREADVFDVLTQYAASRRRFDTIVLDPPAFAKSRATIEGALRGYKDINLRALKLLEPGGILITCSCSHHVTEAHLLQVLAEASLDAGKVLRVVERRTQAADHPLLLTVPETLYLKCLILEVV
jgi:23S rRNA (cytosine1962-C5)-methyltransferase